jgi:hypothetical protein
MADDPKAVEKTESKQQSEPAPAAVQPSADAIINPEYVPAEQALKKLDKPEVLSLAAYISSKLTLGPDPESAKLMAQTEMHHETCRLDGYKENLKNQDAENERRHTFRMQRLHYDTLLTGALLLLAILGAGTGLYLTVTQRPTLGSNILIASVAIIYYLIGGKNPFHRKDE